MYAANSCRKTAIHSIMELSTDIEIKQENDSSGYEDDNKNLLDVSYDIKIEFDAGLDSYLREVTNDHDWSVQNYSNEAHKSVSYEELLDYCIFKCQPCCKTFTNRYQLLKHNLCHLALNISKISVFQCNDCSNYYLLRRKLISHIKTKHQNHYGSVTKMLHQCHICSKVLSYSSWYSHMKEVHCKRQHKCDICGYSFKAKRYLRRHIIFKHQGVPRHIGVTAKKENILIDIKCELCPAILKNKNALKTHIRNCHSDKQFKCALCKLVFKSRPYLFCHLRRRHILDEDVFECRFCHMKFKWKQMLDIHISTCKNMYRKLKQ